MLLHSEVRERITYDDAIVVLLFLGTPLDNPSAAIKHSRAAIAVQRSADRGWECLVWVEGGWVGARSPSQKRNTPAPHKEAQ